MTKSVLVTLVLLGITFGIFRVWFFDRPSTDPVRMGTGFEQSRGATVDSSLPSRPQGRQVAKSSANSPLSAATPSGGASAPTAPAVKFVQPKPGDRQDAVFPGVERREGFAISGLVQDEEGYPLANVEVQAEAIYPPDADKLTGGPSHETSQSVWTNFNGSFYFEGLADGEYRIRVVPIHGFAAAETTARVGVMSANLVLTRLRDVRVYGLVDSTEGTLLEDVRVIAGPPTRVVNTGTQGDYELDVSIKGKNRPLTIHFRHEGYRDQSIRLDSAGLDDLLDFQLDVSMEPLKGLTVVTGRLEDPDGHPVAYKIINMNSPELQNSYRVQSDVRGHFAIEDVEPGKDYRLSVRPGADYRDYEKTQLEIPPGGLQLGIILEPLVQGEISGFMTDAEGKPIPGFALTLHSKVAAGRSIQAVGDNTGFFAVEGFPEGNAVLKTNSYPIFETQGIRVSPETEEPVSVVLDMGPHALFGRVTNVFGDRVAASEVSLGWQQSENGVRNYSARKTTADQNGDFALTGLGSGVHTLRVNAPGFSMAVIKIDVGLDPNNIVVELDEEA